MEFKDYYTTLGVARTATKDEIKRAYRKLARKFHPDVSKEKNAESRFKDIAEAYEALGDTEKRAAYDDVGKRHADGADFEPPAGWDAGFEFTGRNFGGDDDAAHSAFFESLFGRQRAGARGPRPSANAAGSDHHAKIQISLLDSYRGVQRSISLRVPQLDAGGLMTLKDRTLDVNIPKGIRAGQHLRLSGQGSVGQGNGPAGDLYLEIEFAPDSRFRIEGSDVYLDLPISPWEAVLGASVTVPTPDGSVQLSVPPGSVSERKMRLKGKGIPASTPGDLYVVLNVVLPPADTAEAKDIYRGMAASFPDFNPRRAQEA